MNRTYKILIILLIVTLCFNTNRALQNKQEGVISWVDSQGYWLRLAKAGIVEYNPEIKTAPAIFTGSDINAILVSTEDSPDVPVTEESSTQSENSVAINPLDESVILNSNNSTDIDVEEIYGADDLYSFDSGETWEGDIEGAGSDNNGDPVSVIGLSGRWFINFINENCGMGVSYSDNEGETWTEVQAAPNPGDLTDKGHMCIDNNPDSPFEGNLYVSWTNVGGVYNGEIGFSYSTDNGESWTYTSNISSAINAGSHNQGVNLCTGPDGELYAFWAVYDSWPSDECAIGMAVSYDGGQSWSEAVRIIENIQGIRTSLTSKDLRVNSFPVAVVDNTDGADRSAVYVTWTNLGIPGINTGNDIDIYIIKSVDYGETWSEPLRVNTDPEGLGKEHFMQWITCDQYTGILSMVFYDDRNVSSTQCEVFCANSIDGGQTWEDFKVSDVAFTPAPIPGLADSYMGDYLGISASNGKVYPVWTDNRTGNAMSYCSPYDTDPVNRPENLTGEIEFETGLTTLNWTFTNTSGFSYFIIYRDGDSIAYTTDTCFTEYLPEYGYYSYRVTAFYENSRESGASGIKLTWGNVIIEVTPLLLYKHLATNQVRYDTLLVKNNGQLPIEYSISLLPGNNTKGYCSASGGSTTGQEYIKSVELGSISNLNTACDNYTDYTNMSTTMEVGYYYPIKVVNGHPYDYDQCTVWVDWNINEVFDDNEMFSLESIADSGYFRGVITPLPGSSSGQTRMRVRLSYTGTPSPCGTTTFGEVEDYSINCNGWMDISPMEGVVSSGNTDYVIITYNAVNLPPGDYSCKAVVSSNDTSNPVINVNISLLSDNLVVEAKTTDDSICLGSSVYVMASIFGIYNRPDYLWHSNPEGFSSIIARPLAIPLEPTWFIVEVTEDGNYSTDSVFVDILPVPVFSLGNDTTICDDLEIILAVDSSFSEFIWSTGDTTRNITVDSSGADNASKKISLTVFNDYGCSYTDEITISFTDCSSVSETPVNDIKIYPIPASNEAFVKGIPNCNSLNITIFSPEGKLVYNENHLWNKSVKIDLQTLNSGLYFVYINFDDHYITKEIIIKKN